MTVEAAKCGIRLHMRRDSVSALAPEAITLDRSPDKEKRALEAIATALMQFTPEIVFQEDFSILLDVSASLTLFKGVGADLKLTHRADPNLTQGGVLLF